MVINEKESNKMTHTEIIGAWFACSDLIKTLNLECNIFLEGFRVTNKKDILIYKCEDVNELYAFLIGYSFKDKEK